MEDERHSIDIEDQEDGISGNDSNIINADVDATFEPHHDVDDDHDDDGGGGDEMEEDTTSSITATQQPPSQQDEHQNLQELYPYQCCMEITLPNIPQKRRNNKPLETKRDMAKELQSILQVDPELTKQTYKVITTRCSSSSSYSNSRNSNSNDTSNDRSNHDDVLVVHFYATQCKGLRVSISSFLEYIQVALKCYQEFA